MITGDKQETAINIAISCKLIRHPDSLLICNADSPEAAARRIDELSAQIRKMRGEPERAQVSHAGPPRKRGFFARFAHLNPFEDEEANPKHQQNLHLTIAKVGAEFAPFLLHKSRPFLTCSHCNMWCSCASASSVHQDPLLVRANSWHRFLPVLLQKAMTHAYGACGSDRICTAWLMSPHIQVAACACKLALC